MGAGVRVPRQGGAVSAGEMAQALTLNQKPVVIAGSSGQLNALVCQYHSWWHV
jgi:hypothetical protein